MAQFLIASTNSGKIKEIRELFSASDMQLLSLKEFSGFPDVPETGSTFKENALIKAHAYFKFAGIPVLADDSGLVTDALNGAPGVYSARFAGPTAGYAENNQRLVKELSAFLPPYTARFVCAAVFYNGQETICCQGTVEGNIQLRPTGANGFGYDPHFVPQGYSATLAELQPEVKNAISHRGKAFRGLYKLLLEKNLVYELR